MNETKHSAKRSRERLGLNKKSTQKNTEKAFNYGIGQADIKNGSLSKYIYSVFCQNRSANNIRIYNQFVYIFAGETLITVFGLPKMYIQQATKIQKRKEQECFESLAI